MIPRKKVVDLLKGSHSSEYDVKYIDLTTGRTHEKKFAEREMYDLYKLQREGKVSIASIHKVASFGSHSPQWIDTRFEDIRAKKKKEWTAAGFPERLQTRALIWAEEYSIGMAETITKDPELRERIKKELYPQALELSEKWMKGLMEAFLPK